ncbi:hypothetical protein RD792_015441 [Penstemon davidsonii]|uniref:Protein kinase domain-containing protein n=1 Tax=Penstemon davidsonii TaxID=160366 RepID=A0ABR0CSN2_9LAMI|nr:hypothetical protein RD792_015441 [Penstemon davidsonii]
MVDCDSPIPRIQFQYGGDWYDILHKNSTNSLFVRSPSLQHNLGSPNCLSFTNLSLPNSPSSSFTISPSMNLFLCYNESRDQAINEYFQSYSLHRCAAFNVYYRNPNNSSSSASVIDIPGNCSMIQMPSNQDYSGGDHLLSMLTSEFTLEWNVSGECNDCHRRGGQCTTSNMNQFLCRTVALSVTALLAISIILLFIYCREKHKPFLKSFGRQNETVKENDIKNFLKKYENLAQKRYKYSRIKKMTNSFGDKLGKGGYGDVYKGKLPDDRLVAVKILNESKGNGEEFINEVESISKTSHVNIVNLLGFCFEGSKRALIYEFMPNGSLEKFISSSSSTELQLGWEKLFDIAVGIARGLDYLHRGCNTRILHFDIKPHNILLDENLTPKISDFGLAKLCPNRSSIVSMLGARGTIGYIAPEVFCRNFGEVSHKSDVYSYGMMVLEMAVGKQEINTRVDCSSEMYFPESIYRHLELKDDSISSIVKEDDGCGFSRKMIIVGLWCIQTDPKNRPAISGVLEMLEGNVELLQIPPKPYLSSPPRAIMISGNANSSNFEYSSMFVLFCLISNGFARDSFADGGSSFAAYFERRCWASGGHVLLVAED